MAMEVRQLHPLFVGEAEGVTLSPDLDEAMIEAIRKAMDEYGVLVFHGQSLDDDALLALGRRFGSIAAPRNHRVIRRLAHGEITPNDLLDALGLYRGAIVNYLYMGLPGFTSLRWSPEAGSWGSALSVGWRYGRGFSVRPPANRCSAPSAWPDRRSPSPRFTATPARCCSCRRFGRGSARSFGWWFCGCHGRCVGLWE